MDTQCMFSAEEVVILEANHIYNANEVKFSRKNIILGENGSGKTRFLKTVEQIYRNRNDSKIILLTFYFPDIEPRILDYGSRDDASQSSLDAATYIYDLLQGDKQINSVDFLETVSRANDCLTFANNYFTRFEMQTPIQKQKAQQALDKLNSVLKTFLNREFIKRENKIFVQKHSGNEEARICSLEEAFKPEEISPGELMLFYLALFVSFVETVSDKKIVIIMDEPEQHIHLQKQLLVIKQLLESEKITDMWIASHSILLLPLFDFESIVLLDNSRIVKRNSHLYESAFQSLVGLENHNIFEFVTYINYWKYYRFISECFTSSKVIPFSKASDEQFKKTLRRIRDRRSTRPLNILDYGAGKCRLWECMKEEFEGTGNLAKLVDYFAYEPKPDGDFVPDKRIHFITDLKKLEKLAMKFDVVILMNVLHEISIFEWRQTFDCIFNCLAQDGVLLLLEVEQLVQGEQPCVDNGYLVLGDEQVRILFPNGEVGKSILGEGEKSNIWTIERGSLYGLTDRDVLMCISNLRDSTEGLLKKAFEKKLGSTTNNKMNEAEMRGYAFISQQYINAMFAAKELIKREKQIRA